MNVDSEIISVRRYRTRLLFVGLVVGLPALVLLSWEGSAMGRNPAFRFENYGRSSNEEAQKEVAAHLDAMFPAGTRVDSAIGYLENAGAKCRELLKYPDFIYCTYNHAASGLRAPFITIEWKILVWHDGSKDRLSRIEVNRGMTGL